MAVSMDALFRAAAAVLPLRFVRPTPTLSGTLFRSGDLEVRLAVRKREVRKAQRLRYKIFYKEGGATPDRTAALIRRDICAYDRVSDHLLVIDHAHRNRRGARKPRIVGCYRLLRDIVASQHVGFYSAQEFDLAPMIARHSGKRFLELGRACVAASHRNRHTLDLLWRGIGAYIRHYRIDVLIGCASLPGTDPVAHAAALRFLTVDRRAEDEFCANALRGNDPSFDPRVASALDARAALALLPPLVKGYLRCGAVFGDGFVIDRQFGTIDVLAIMPVESIAPRYLQHFAGIPEDRAA